MICPPGFHVEEICVADPVSTPVWTDLGAVPAIAGSPTVQARSICQLQPHNGKVYLGYGDWTDTKQPGCDLIAYDIAAGAFLTIIHIATDALWSHRIVNGELWAITTDPEIGADPDVTIVRADGSLGAVSGGLSMYPWHLFDAVWWQGKPWVAGADRSQGESKSYPTVWAEEPRIPDGARKWFVKYQRVATGAGRMHGLFVHGGWLYAAGSNGKMVRTIDGVTWIDFPINVPTVMTKPMNRDGDIYYRADWPAVREGWLYHFNGYSQNAIANVRDHYVDGSDLWTLAADKVSRNNEIVATAPAGSRSLCVVDGAVFVGTADSRLWVYR